MGKTLLAATFSLVLVAACGSDEPAGTTAVADATSASDTTASDADSGAAGTITMSNISFSGVTTVQVGDTIDLANEDQVAHTWTAEDGTFDISMSPGDTRSYTFEEPGEYSYFCSIHPSMEGTITVEG